MDKNIFREQILNVINYTKEKDVSYNAKEFESAYHSIRLGDKNYQGQRDNNWRLDQLGFDFQDKVVLDIGCNVGGMLHNLADKLKLGIGLDYNPNCINAANLIKAFNQNDNLQFFVFDLQKQELEFIRNFILTSQVDICFLLSVCMWLPNWQEIIQLCAKLAPKLFFETNGIPDQQKAQIDFLQTQYKVIKLAYQSSLDDPNQQFRTGLFCIN